MTSPERQLTHIARNVVSRQSHPAAFALVLWFATMLAACDRSPDIPTLSGSTMGTTWQVRLGTDPDTISRSQLHAEIDALLEAINQTMSTYRDDSELSRVNHAPAGTRIELSPELAFVTTAALNLARDTGGAYDPTVGPLVNLWGFGPDPVRTEAPTAQAIETARRRVGWQRLEFDPATRGLTQPGDAYLDLSSIAKGYAVDRVAELLARHGIGGFVIDIGGEVLTRGTRPDGSRWRVAIERPIPGERGTYRVIVPQNLAVATSGTYRNHFREAGREYAHLIDPRTGYPVTHDLVSVSVVAATCMEADALATALSVLGTEAALAYARERGLAVLLLRRQDEHLRDYTTPEFRALLE